MADRFSVPHAFGSYEDMCGFRHDRRRLHSPADAQHVEWTVKAADAGKHGALRKADRAEGGRDRPADRARDRNAVLLSEAYLVTYAPVWRKVRELLAEGAIGTLRHVQGAFTYFNRDPGNMRNIPELGGGGLPDIGVYRASRPAS